MTAAGRLEGRVAAVTGASRGIGRAIGRAMADAGARVALLSRSEEALQRVKAEIEALGGMALVAACDVARPDQVDRAVERVVESWGRLDVLVNNAGMSIGESSALETPHQDWQRILAVNLSGAFYCAQAAGRVMVRQGSGIIINITSIAAFTPIPWETAYCVSKAGLEGLTRSLALELAPHGVRVVSLAPGYVTTDMNRPNWQRAGQLEDQIRHGARDEASLGAEERHGLEVFRKVTGRTPLGRYGTPQEVAAAAVFLATDQASFLTGASLVCDGGWLVRE